jgi:hypothetical protein
LPPGVYQLTVSLITGGEAAAVAGLGPVEVVKTDRVYAVPSVGTPLEALFGDEVRLLGYALEPAAGGARLTLTWQAERQPTRDYTVFVHALNPDGTCCAWQADAMPRDGSYPTTRWREGEVVVDAFVLSLPAGTFPLEAGLYLPETGARLPVSPGAPGQDALRLGEVVVEE